MEYGDNDCLLVGHSGDHHCGGGGPMMKVLDTLYVKPEVRQSNAEQVVSDMRAILEYWDRGELTSDQLLMEVRAMVMAKG